MRVQDYLNKITWTVADKLLFLVYGFVALLQYKAIPPVELGLTGIIVTTQTWIFILSDGAALQGVIQFGMDKLRRPQVNAISLMLHSTIVMGSSLIVAACASPLSALFGERFEAVALWLPLYCLLTLPRAFCIKILLRDTQMKQVFWVNFSWIGSMTLLTTWMLLNKTLHGFNDMIFISFTGIGISSLVAVIISRDLLRFSLKSDTAGSDGKSSVFTMVTDYLRFGSVQVMIGAVTNAIRQLDVLLLQFFFQDLSVVGFYTAAKTLYRVFEAGMDALFSLLYPAAVRLLPDHRRDEFSVLLSKAVSYLFLTYLVIVIVMECGMTEWVVQFLGARYAHVSDAFNLLALAALFIPFYPLSAVLLASHRNVTLLKYVLVASFSGLVVFVFCGVSGQSVYFPTGVIVYNAVLGILLIAYVRRELNLPATSYLRAAADTLRYFRKSNA